MKLVRAKLELVRARSGSEETKPRLASSLVVVVVGSLARVTATFTDTDPIRRSSCVTR